MDKKESVFISAILYLSDYSNTPEKFIRNLLEGLKTYFIHCELILVNDCCTKHEHLLKEVLPSLGDSTITVVHMSVKQGIEACLKAGLDVSIGDFVFEFDTLESSFKKDLLWDVYQEALKGNDVVSVEPEQNNFSRKLFYRLFNKCSNADYDIHASAFRLVSRRTINRVLELKMSSAFRQAMYASCGLKNSRIEYKGSASLKKARGLSLALDSFLLYTDICKRVCMVSMFLLVSFFSTGIVGMCVNNFIWLFRLSVLLSVLLILCILVLLLYYARLILSETDIQYLISNIEKVQKG